MTQAKKVSEMDGAEYASAKARALEATKVPWAVLARSIREMSQAELDAFENQFEISILCKALSETPYAKMTPVERQAFERKHGLKAGRLGN